MSNDHQVRQRDAGTKFQPMHAGDLATMHRLAQQMSWPHRPEDCALLLQLGAGIVAVDGAEGPVGVGMRWSFGHDAGTIGMMLVARERQGRGIGRALMTSLIADSGSRALMLNATAEGLGLYEKLGFVPTGLVRQHQARFAEKPVVPAAPAVPLRRAAPADHVALCALDAAALGADRSALIHGLLASGDAWLSQGAAGATGFAILRPFGRGTMVGPVVAPDEDAAIALVAAAAKAAPAGVLRVDISAEATRLGEWLTAAGLPAVDTVTTMRRGEWPTLPKAPRRFGLAFQAVG
ncbi:GNAT family N-acetyltransferase [Reyranella sp.]|uniref:GNAT family N-acetyltransferase n=1 Tax=Reyranella sp. TaxID=1929291 RepID=UPI003785270B